MTTQLAFTGVPFDALAYALPEPAPEPAPVPAATAPVPAAQAFTAVAPPPPPPAAASGRPPAVRPSRGAPGVASAARELRLSVARSHEQALRAHDALQRLLLRDGFDGRGPARGAPAGAPASAGLPVPPAFARPVPVSAEAQFKPLARTSVTRLDADALGRLARGDVAGVFGPAYEPGAEAAPIGCVASLLLSIEGLSPRGGSWGRGRLTARTVPLAAADREAAARAIGAAVAQAVEVAALSFGLHLCLADATLSAQCPGLPPAPVQADVAPLAGPVELLIDITAVDLVPRPYVRADARVIAGGQPAGFVRDVTVAVTERPGVPVGPEHGGLPTRWLGRLGAGGEPAILSEFHLAHACRGDQGIGLGPEFARYTGRKATRPPDGGLLLIDRVMEIGGRRGVLDGGSIRTEYDSPADSWYYAETANASMPNCIYMETSLQSALLLGYYLGPTLAMPDGAVSLRNLGGTATVLREIDLRDTTISERARLLSTSLVPGSSLQSFDYAQSAGGVPYYQGETLFGYFSDAAMAQQTGLDAGRHVPPWLESPDAAGAAARRRTIDIAARRDSPGAGLVSRDHLALLDSVDVIDDGGQFGQGYLFARRPIDPGAWFFARHFRYDPVIPGSLGVEAVLHAMQEWVVDSGYAAGLRSPGFVLPVGAPFTWKYRGQLLPTDGEFTLEVHIKSVEQRPGRVRVTGDASLWKPGLRIYHLADAAVELREEGAPPWRA
jgi:3-hydroxymyristoyl/3-hydroxydecanoyl-(acyl carrier protein) dehydratase